ncbi:MAG TPA: DUF1905 domain-containing protein [Actinomycetes bacterium]|nr:DUF1905 domain-containing protein [Actinomycetes bacterium]
MELQFAGEVIHWKGPAPFYFVTVPEEESDMIASVSALATYGWGVIPVTVVIGKTEWTTALFPKEGSYLVPLKVVVRRAERIELGNVVDVQLTIDV